MGAFSSVQRAAPDRQQWRQWHGRAGDPFKASAVYRLKLKSSVPMRAVVTPRDGRPGNPVRGEAIMRGQWRFDDAHLSIRPDRAPWGPAFPGLHFADRVHRFGWLRDIAALGPLGAEHARALALSWTLAFGKWDDFAWRIDVTAERVMNWLVAAPCILDSLEGEARTHMLECLGRQIQHLQMSLASCPLPQGRAKAAVSLCLAGLSFPDYSRALQLGLATLKREYDAQILEDGSHASRSPQALAESLIDLHTIRDLLIRGSRSVPNWLPHTQSRMARMMHFLSVPGGGYLVSNGGDDGRVGLMQAALEACHDLAGGGLSARPSGYRRVNANSLTLFMDVGPAPEGEHAGNAHAGCLSICMFDGEDPLITSCGAHADSAPDWREAARGTAGHSTLMLDSCQSAQFSTQDRTGMVIPVGPAHVSARQSEEKDQSVIDARHGGWLLQYGLVHRRRLFVAKNGVRLIGEDSLVRSASSNAGSASGMVSYSIRFHLHPDIEAMPGPDRTSLYLTLRRTGHMWRFRSDGCVKLETSIYAAGGCRRKTMQILIQGEADSLGDGENPPNRVRWALTRMEAKHSL